MKLDGDPKLFFLLRNVEMEKLIKDSLTDRSKDLLGKAHKKTGRVIDGAEADKMFGIAMQEKTPEAKTSAGKGKRGKTLKPQRPKAAGKAGKKKGKTSKLSFRA